MVIKFYTLGEEGAINRGGGATIRVYKESNK